jgi:hypothetical protein
VAWLPQATSKIALAISAAPANHIRIFIENQPPRTIWQEQAPKT